MSLRSLALLLAIPWSAAQPQRQAAPVARIDWADFLGKHDLVWERLPTRWGESAFIGNGLLGATIDVQDGVLGWTIWSRTRWPTLSDSGSAVAR